MAATHRHRVGDRHQGVDGLGIPDLPHRPTSEIDEDGGNKRGSASDGRPGHRAHDAPLKAAWRERASREGGFSRRTASEPCGQPAGSPAASSSPARAASARGTVTAAHPALLAADQGKRVAAGRGRRQEQTSPSCSSTPRWASSPARWHPGVFAMADGTTEGVRCGSTSRWQAARSPCFGRIGPMARAPSTSSPPPRPGVKEIPHRREDRLGTPPSRSRAAAELGSHRVDAAATGHVISQLDAPGAIQELVAVGPIRKPDGMDWSTCSPIPALTRASTW